MITLNQDQIKEAIPHRYENLLLDSVTIQESEQSLSGQLSLTIYDQDREGRDIFLAELQRNKKYLALPVYAEIMALVSIVSSRSRLIEGYTSIFAGISNFNVYDFHAENKELTGSMALVSDRKGFYKYEGFLEANGKRLCDGCLTAFYTPTQNLVQKDESDLQLIDVPAMSAVSKENRAKRPDMFICDGLNLVESDSFIAQYTYPTDHALVKGHFPGSPLMMGIMQWMCAEDSLCAYLEASNQTGQSRYLCSFKLQDRYGRAVADIMDIECEAFINTEHCVNQVYSRSVKKILFKKIIQPGETVYIYSQKIQRL
jgi:3-hydroxymyristoyl/3-hydroxydecanoyl-(acyl carrier protein) dehydratase